MKKLFVLHPFLLAVFPILFLFAHNIEQTHFEEIIAPSLFVLFFVLLFQVFLTLIFYRSNNRQEGKKKIALIVSLFLVIFFSYGHIYNSLEGFKLLGFVIGKGNYIFAALLLILFAGIYFLIRTKKNLNNPTTFLNIVSVSLVIISIFNIAVYKSVSKDVSEKTGSSVNSNQVLQAKIGLPNIYYIILDGYASSSTLREEFNYSNSDFENYLTGNGFYIASESRSNYAETMLSLASSLNMELLKTEVDSLTEPKLLRMILTNKVMKIFKSNGYRIVTLASNMGSLQRFTDADWNIKCSGFFADEFHQVLLESTILSRLKKYINISNPYREKILCTFSKLSYIHHEIKKPSFIFCHILLPHPPFVFGRNGEPTNEKLAFKDVWDKKKRYLDQLIFTNKMMKKVIKKILSEAGDESVIIIQGDHGPFITLGKEINDRIIKARMRILNAFYFPEDVKNIFYNSITPVNTFRLIFNNYLNTSYELVEDRNYFTNYTIPYKFLDVTEKIVSKNFK